MTQLLINENFLQIDHIFVCLETAPDKQFLQDLGLIYCDNVTYHPQQGTASAIIFFENTYIEFIWVKDETIAEIYAINSGIDLIARSYSLEKTASPFGIALHQQFNIDNQSYGSSSTINNQSSEQFINFAASNLVTQAEPLCFIIPESVSFLNIFNPSFDPHQKLVNHPLGIRKLTNTKIAMRKLGKLTNPISMLDRNRIIEIEQNCSPLLELTFDHSNRGENIDLRVIDIPIVLKY